MEDMEIDLDFEDDPVKNFLLQRLREIRATNANLDADIINRNQLLKTCQEKIAKVRGGLEIASVWKLVFNSKCIFGIVVTSTKPGHVRIDDVILNWNSSNPVVYDLKLYEKRSASEEQKGGDCLEHQWIDVDAFQTGGTIVLVVAKPVFLKQLGYNLDGIVNYNLDGDGFQVSLPRLSISVEDFTDASLEVKPCRLMQGGDEEFLAYLEASERIRLVGGLSNEARRSPENLLAIDCMLREVEVVSKSKYFLVHGISSIVDGCLVELLPRVSRPGVFYFNVFSQNQEQMKQLLHYLHKCIGGLMILPKSHDVHLLKPTPSSFQSFVADDDDDEEFGRVDLEEFRENLEREIKFVEKFYVQNNSGTGGCGRNEYVKFRSDLNEVECETDRLYAKLDFSRDVTNRE